VSDAADRVTDLRNEVLFFIIQRKEVSRDEIMLAISEIKDLQVKTRERYLRRWCSDQFLRSTADGKFVVTNRGKELLRRKGFL